MNTNFSWRINIPVCYFVLLSVVIVRTYTCAFVCVCLIHFCKFLAKCATHTHAHTHARTYTEWHVSVTCGQADRSIKHVMLPESFYILKSRGKNSRKKRKNQENRCSFLRTHGWSGFVSRARPKITRASCSRRSAHARTQTQTQTQTDTHTQTYKRTHHTDGSKSERLCVRV